MAHAIGSGLVRLAVSLLAVLALLGPGAAGAQPKVIKIGAVYPLTGNIASTGLDCRRGAELAVDIINGKYDLDLPLARTQGLPNLKGAQVEVIFGETDESHPFVDHEQMMPFVPFVKCPDVDVAIALAKKYEHGFKHTAIIHSRNVDTITRMGREMDVTIFVQNGPCTAGLGEAYLSFSIATPTGEGVTTLRVEAEFEDAQFPANLLAGLSADVEIILEARDNVLRIPTYALLENNRVLVVQNGLLAERKVTTGLHNWSFTEITSGLSAGESVVVSLDRPEVKAGARVTVSGEAQK